jgi:toxin ParE1/3/4
MKVRLSGKAKRDLLEIYSYLADLNEPAAERLMSRISQKFEYLSEFPFIGRERSQFGRGLRSVAVAEHVIFYSVEREVTVVRVIDGRMDLEREFREWPLQ